VDDLLTTKQLQELLQVDRITIYRMLRDGRLHGFKVGGQWRFSHQEIERWLREQQATLDVSHESLPAQGPIVPSAQALPIHCIEAMQAVYAEALDVAVVTVDLAGQPLTGVTNSCDFCNLVLSTDEGRQRCAAAWTSVPERGFLICHAGLFCLSAPIVVGGKRVAVTASCQFVARPRNGSNAWRVDSANVAANLAADLDLSRQELDAAAEGVRRLPGDALDRLPRLLQRVVDTFSEIGQERLNLLSRLQRIAEISQI
jgi:excisionase family DNA binding protein